MPDREVVFGRGAVIEDIPAIVGLGTRGVGIALILLDVKGVSEEIEGLKPEDDVALFGPLAGGVGGA